MGRKAPERYERLRGVLLSLSFWLLIHDTRVGSR